MSKTLLVCLIAGYLATSFDGIPPKYGDNPTAVERLINFNKEACNKDFAKGGRRAKAS